MKFNDYVKAVNIESGTYLYVGSVGCDLQFIQRVIPRGSERDDDKPNSFTGKTM